ncbi:MAG TPA: ornithine cyclodeaminase family protein [Cyclobacteriaceae bacterium]|jgi:ornithine cyclodeaminase|nr:ornithine cyclodeaminase family protein [Cyclobacteriaceae bacterium]
MLVISNQQVGEILSLPAVIAAVEKAIVAHEEKLATVPPRMHIDNGKNTLLCMPSWGKDVFGTKLVAVAPDNATKNLPVTNGAMLLNDGATGMPLALINASKLTAMRTGAVGAIGLKHISPSDESTVGLIGCGVQGAHQVVFACAVRPIKTVYHFDPVTTKAAEMVALMKHHHPNVKLVACSTSEEVVERTNIVIAATTSAAPVFANDEPLVSGKHFVSVGSYKPAMQELPDAVYRLAGELCIDSEFACTETGDIINPLKKGFINEENVYTIGKLLMGKRKINTAKTTVFKSAGMALFDLYVAQLVYEEAMGKKRGTEVTF